MTPLITCTVCGQKTMNHKKRVCSRCATGRPAKLAYNKGYRDGRIVGALGLGE